MSRSGFAVTGVLASSLLLHLGWTTTALASLAPSVVGTPSPKYCPSTCQDLFINLNASASTIAVPPLTNLSAPGAITKLLATVPDVVAGGKTQEQSAESYISARYCEPTAQKDAHPDVIQLLVHGGTYQKDYWAGGGYHDFDGDRYSWIAYAASQGYASLSIDQLGNGQSSHLEPANVVQASLQEAIVHEIILQLKAGQIGSKAYPNVVYVGHSLGSLLGTRIAQDHATDATALILTGFSNDISNNAALVDTWNLAPAADVWPQYHALQPGYLAIQNEAGRTNSFYYQGRYEPNLPHLDFELEGTLSVGEAFGLSSMPAPAYTGPVLVVTGDHDAVFCGNVTPANCLPASSSPPAKSASYFKHASSFDYILAHESGHLINFHYSAPDTFAQVHDWISRQEFV
ncbi:MAG: cis-prenyltransferase [Chaenotheca gracillima]|nr:MAG: cis-prenyltransferase [Chaenotheca gracillima]